MLLSPLDVVVVPACHRAFGNAEKASDIGDVGEINETGAVSEKAFGGMSALSNRRVRGGEEAFAALALILRRTDDEFDCLIAQG